MAQQDYPVNTCGGLRDSSHAKAAARDWCRSPFLERVMNICESEKLQTVNAIS